MNRARVFHLVESAALSKNIYSLLVYMVFTLEVFLMGVLVKTAQKVEYEVGRAREQFEPRLRMKLKKAKADWIELRARTNAPVMTRAELRTRAFLIRTDLRVRIFMDRLIGRIITELEKVRRTLPRK